MAVTIRMEDGMEATHETTAYRGQLGDFVAALAQSSTGPTDMYGSGGDMYGMGEEEGMMGGALPGGPGMPTTQNRATARRGDDEEEEKISHATGMLLLDMVGGQRLHTTDATLVEPGSLLLLAPDGNLMIREQLDDQEEFLVYHVPEEKKPSKRDRKNERAPGYDPSGGSAGGMEEMYGFGGDSGGAAGSRRGGRRGSRGSRGGGSEEE
ncbi:MAG: hypothetical protein HQ582_11220 [Planctomycetes bacterium]|nr:hypothetical protein [Planctomycetota bacterium]